MADELVFRFLGSYPLAIIIVEYSRTILRADIHESQQDESGVFAIITFTLPGLAIYFTVSLLPIKI